MARKGLTRIDSLSQGLLFVAAVGRVIWMWPLGPIRDGTFTMADDSKISYRFYLPPKEADVTRLMSSSADIQGQNRIIVWCSNNVVLYVSILLDFSWSGRLVYPHPKKI